MVGREFPLCSRARLIIQFTRSYPLLLVIIANGKIKNWKFFAQTVQNSSLPFIGDCLDIVCAIINRYHCPAMADIRNGREIARQMRAMWKEENALQKRLELLKQRKALRWSKYDAAMCFFPSLTEEHIRNLTFGMYGYVFSVKTLDYSRLIPN